MSDNNTNTLDHYLANDLVKELSRFKKVESENSLARINYAQQKFWQNEPILAWFTFHRQPSLANYVSLFAVTAV